MTERLSNLVQLDREYAAGHSRLAGLPREAYLEVAARCNLRCPLCPITVDPRYQPGADHPRLLAPAVFDRLEPLFATLDRVHLLGLGEPLLNPHLEEWTARLARAGVEVRITTNATLLDAARARALARAGVARVTVSLDAARAETYARIRVNGRFERALEGVRELVAARAEEGRPEVYLTFLTLASNAEELPELIELAHQLGVQGVFAERPYAFDHPELARRVDAELPERLGTARLAAIFSDTRQRAAELEIAFSARFEPTAPPPAAPSAGDPPPAAEGVAPRLPRPARGDGQPPRLPWPCPEPWRTINVNAAGEVRTCCFNNDSLGNLTTASFDAVWNGPRYQALRTAHAAREVTPGCASCVRQGRVQRAADLFQRPAPPVGATRRCVLELPTPGGVVGDPLVLVGRWRLPVGRELPNLLIDGEPFDLRPFTVCRRWRFASVLPVPFLSAGGHRLELGFADGRRSQAIDVQMVRSAADAPPLALDRLAVVVDEVRAGDRPTDAWIDARRTEIVSWTAGAARGPGVAVIAVPPFLTGSHEARVRVPGRRLLRQPFVALGLPAAVDAVEARRGWTAATQAWAVD